MTLSLLVLGTALTLGCTSTRFSNPCTTGFPWTTREDPVYYMSSPSMITDDCGTPCGQAISCSTSGIGGTPVYRDIIPGPVE